MKVLPWILVALLAIGCLFLYLRPQRAIPANVQRDTVIRIDTVRDSVPVPYKVCIVRIDTVYMRVVTSKNDTVKDSILVELPIMQKEYKTKEYHAWVSGYMPNLDSIDTYIPTTIINNRIKEKKRRFGLGISAGYGFTKQGLSPTVSVGVYYRIW